MGIKLIERFSKNTANAKQVTEEIVLLNLAVVNAFLIGDPLSDGKEFILVDTGLENSYSFIIESVDKYYGKDMKPKGIVITHGHYEHIGSAIKLSEYWDVPIYIHKMELPYIIGEKEYLKDTESGKVLESSFEDFRMYLEKDSTKIITLSDDRKIPGMPKWKWIHTPGHTAGHISLFNEINRTLIAADAFYPVSDKLNLLPTINQKQNKSPLPIYLDEDWNKALDSIRDLISLNPHILITSHGKPIRGLQLTEYLDSIANNLNNIRKK